MNPQPIGGTTPTESQADADGVALRTKLQRAGSLSAFHWIVVLLSLALTVGAWLFSKQQADARVAEQFEREAQRVVDLVRERMEKYEDALRSGVSFVQASGGEVSYQEWKSYASNLHLVQRYPGINGIGVITALERSELPSYLERRRAERADFSVYPEHSEDVLYPITFIEPVAINSQALGLDVAHEFNRLTAANAARDTGLAQVTGPIVLVQDANKTPGFLFYAPYYATEAPGSVEERRASFRGMVYAPFVVDKLMDGTLAASNRHVGLSIADGAERLYDEHSAEYADFDPDPLFKHAVDLSFYGRVWSFDVWSANSFRDAQRTLQPLTILLGGILIDVLLVGLFLVVSRANRNALAYADALTEEMKLKGEELTRSNQELERFAYLASHDLQEPLRMVASFAELLDADYESCLDARGREWLGFMVDGARRMQQLVHDLLRYSRAGSEGYDLKPIAMNAVVDQAFADLAGRIGDSGGRVTRGELPVVLGEHGQAMLVVQNLVSNALKFCGPEVSPIVEVTATTSDGWCEISVSDNGIGIQKDHLERIFVIFQRFHAKDAYPGTGLGLAISKKIVERHGGELRVDSKLGEGSVFTFTLPVCVESVPPLPRRRLKASVGA